MTDASDPNDPSAPERPDVSANRGQSMWGGRFSAKPAELMQAINVSIGFDRRLAHQDLKGSRAHAAMLTKAGQPLPDRPCGAAGSRASRPS